MNKGTASMKRKKAAAKRAVSQGLIVLGCLLIYLIWVQIGRASCRERVSSPV